jgi:hypothetical protein
MSEVTTLSGDRVLILLLPIDRIPLMVVIGSRLSITSLLIINS